MQATHRRHPSPAWQERREGCHRHLRRGALPAPPERRRREVPLTLSRPAHPPAPLPPASCRGRAPDLPLPPPPRECGEDRPRGRPRDDPRGGEPGPEGPPRAVFGGSPIRYRKDPRTYVRIYRVVRVYGLCLRSIHSASLNLRRHPDARSRRSEGVSVSQCIWSSSAAAARRERATRLSWCIRRRQTPHRPGLAGGRSGPAPRKARSVIAKSTPLRRVVGTSSLPLAPAALDGAGRPAAIERLLPPW